MLKFLVDEDVPRALVVGLKRHKPETDVVRVQDVGLRTKPDAVILAWAAEERRVLVSRDRSTMPRCASDRIRRGLPMPGLLILGRRWGTHLREIINDLVLLSDDSPEEWEHRIEYLPL